MNCLWRYLKRAYWNTRAPWWSLLIEFGSGIVLYEALFHEGDAHDSQSVLVGVVAGCGVIAAVYFLRFIFAIARARDQSFPHIEVEGREALVVPDGSGPGRYVVIPSTVTNRVQGRRAKLLPPQLQVSDAGKDVVLEAQRAAVSGRGWEIPSYPALLKANDPLECHFVFHFANPASFQPWLDVGKLGKIRLVLFEGVTETRREITIQAIFGAK